MSSSDSKDDSRVETPCSAPSPEQEKLAKFQKFMTEKMAEYEKTRNIIQQTCGLKILDSLAHLHSTASLFLVHSAIVCKKSGLKEVMETALKQKASIEEEAREYFTEAFLGEDEDKYDDFINKMNLNIRYI